ncbi:hypothetical protein HYS50_02980 [Candidatus Woesearchaeota archaeon]|nr:hypothetical protein [Candidatus Woesearchaeota archaeon]
MKKNIDAAAIRTLNNKDRMWFVKRWAEYVKTHSDKEWSEQQNIIINSQLQSAQATNLTPEQYLKIKEAGKSKRHPNRRS